MSCSFLCPEDRGSEVLRIPRLNRLWSGELGLALQGGAALMDVDGHAQELPFIPTIAYLSPAQERYFSTALFNTVRVFRRDRTCRQSIYRSGLEGMVMPV